jgi:hypothetical protein
MLVFARTHLRGALTTEPSLQSIERDGHWMIIEVDVASKVREGVSLGCACLSSSLSTLSRMLSVLLLSFSHLTPSRINTTITRGNHKSRTLRTRHAHGYPASNNVAR